MHEGLQALKRTEDSYGSNGVWPQEEFMTRIKDHERRITQIVDMDRMAMVKGGSIAHNIEA
jgi:hypothetical protein